MREPTNSSEILESSGDTQFTRRELLKSLAALGGAVAASSLLPDTWARPQIGAGVLPAHAQSTLCMPPYTIDHCNIELLPNGVLTTSVWIAPPCPGIQMTLSLIFTIIVNQQPEAKPQTAPPELITDSSGMVSFTTNFPLPPDAQSVYAEWKFFDPADGSDICTTDVIQLNGVVAS
jgi:hypothetical protein